jgi:hypothetical protein
MSVFACRRLRDRMEFWAVGFIVGRRLRARVEESRVPGDINTLLTSVSPPVLRGRACFVPVIGPLLGDAEESFRRGAVRESGAACVINGLRMDRPSPGQ